MATLRCQRRLNEHWRRFDRVDTTHLLDGVIELSHDGLVGEVELRDIFIVLRERLARDRHLRAINEVGVLQKILDQCGNTANLVKVLHNVLAGWPDVVS